MSPPWAPGSATGVGPLPGTDPLDAAKLVLDELASFPHLPQLPARGAGADAVGRSAALLVDLHVELAAGRWRLVPRSTRDGRRARELLARDLDALEQAGQGHEGTLKVQLLGPWSLACGLELSRGGCALADLGAVRDLATSLAEGLAAHLDEVRRRLPGAGPVLAEVDEPLLPAVLAGEVATASGWGRYPPVEEVVALEVEEAVLRPVGEGAGVRFAGPRAPLDLARRAGARFFSLPLEALTPEVEDDLGTALEAGVGLLAGIVAVSGEGGGRPVDVDELAAPARRLWRRLGLDPALLPRAVVVTPAGGLDEVSPATAGAVLRRSRQVAERLGAEPEGPGP